MEIWYFNANTSISGNWAVAATSVEVLPPIVIWFVKRQLSELKQRSTSKIFT
jgi:hypothetical protein